MKVYPLPVPEQSGIASDFNGIVVIVVMIAVDDGKVAYEVEEVFCFYSRSPIRVAFVTVAWSYVYLKLS